MAKRRKTADSLERELNGVTIAFSSDSETDFSSDTDHNEDENKNEYQLNVPTSLRWKKSITRKRKKREGPRMTENISPNAIRESLSTKCCQKGCMDKFEYDEVFSLRKEFWTKVAVDQTTFIMQQISATHAFDDEIDSARFCVERKYVCVKGWMNLYGIKKSRFYKCRQAVLKGHRNGIDGRTSMSYSSQRYIQASQFLKDYAQKFGEVMPDKEEIQLPSCVNKKTVYLDYKYDIEQDKTTGAISSGHFRKIWREEFPHVKTTKTKRFSKCKACSTFKEALLMNVSKEELQRLQQQKRAHLLLQKVCREKYYKHIKKAKRTPKKYLSVIIDNMDQSKTRLPRFHDIRKGEENLKTLHHHVTGVLNHSHGKAHVFTWTDKFPCDANITINCLLHVFDEVARNNDGHLPEILYLQADNAAKDNKNITLIGFLASLVERKIFKKVKLSFLMVGHTHEDVDQMFSNISRRLKFNSAPTLKELHNQIRVSHTPMPGVKHLTGLWDYRDGVIHHNEKLCGHQTPHVFTITESSERVSLRYKHWPLRSLQYQDLDITNLAKCIIPKPPITRTVDSRFVAELDAMSTSLSKWQSQGRLLGPSIDWWKTYIQYLRTTGHEPSAPSIKEFKKYRRHIVSASPLPPELSNILEKHGRKTREPTKVKLVKSRVVAD